MASPWRILILATSFAYKGVPDKGQPKHRSGIDVGLRGQERACRFWATLVRRRRCVPRRRSLTEAPYGMELIDRRLCTNRGLGRRATEFHAMAPEQNQRRDGFERTPGLPDLGMSYNSARSARGKPLRADAHQMPVDQGLTRHRRARPDLCHLPVRWGGLQPCRRPTDLRPGDPLRA